MENKPITREKVCEIILDYKDGQEINVLENMLNELKLKNATHFDIYVDKDWEGCVESVEFTGVNIAFETNEQTTERLKKENEAREKKERELAQQKETEEKQLLARLKAKYES